MQEFPTRLLFINYTQKFRKNIVPEQGSRVAHIKISGVKNSTGVYRPIHTLIKQQIELSGGTDSILKFNASVIHGIRNYSSPIDSESLQSYYESVPTGSIIVAFDIYADGTLVTSSGSQSVNTVRLRLDNIRGKSNFWHEIGI